MSRGLVMGILNVTPDSFSDGGRHATVADAVDFGMAMITDGADVIDVGGESTRPGAVTVTVDVELTRVIPVIEQLAPHARVSIDTRKPEVARAAVAAGASLINDVSASLDGVAAELGVGWIAMHMRGEPATMQDEPRYQDVVTEVRDALVGAATRARRGGVGEIWVDPGIGFGKTTQHNLALLAGLDELVAEGFPVMVGVSRKRFIGELHARSDQDDALVPVADRREGSVSLATWAFSRGVGMVRAHDVRATVHAAKVVGP